MVMLGRGKRIALLLGFVMLLPLVAGTSSATTYNGPSIHGLTSSSSAEDATVAWYVDGMFIGGYSGNASFGSYSVSDAGLVDHPTIHIDGNAQFMAQATGEGWPGSGTLADPYLIQGYHVLTPPNGTGIKISNVELFFSIRDCLIEPSDPAAYFSPEAGLNITSSKVVDITSVGTYASGQGALIVGVDGVNIANCTLARCGLIGMYVIDSANVTITGSSCAGAAFGTALESAANVTLRANSFVGEEFAGCDCVDAAYTTFESNTCTGCSLILASGVTAETLLIPANNTVNGDPIFFRRGVDFSWETISGACGFVYLYNCSHAFIKSLTMDRVTYCVNLDHCQDIYVEDCALGAGKIPIAFRASDGCCAVNDTVASDPFVGTGILLEGATNSTIEKNLVYNCWRGVMLFAALDNGIRGNVVQNDVIGILVDNLSERNVCIGNMIRLNFGLGVFVDGNDNTFLANTFYDNQKGNANTAWKPSARDEGLGNLWNNSGSPHGFGNYWGNFSSAAHDGILDDPVPILTHASEPRYDHYALEYPPSTPSAPVGLKAASTETGIELTWSSPSNLSGSAVTMYYIYRFSGSAWDILRATTNPSFVDTSVNDGVTFSYKVSAANLLGEGQLSDPVIITYQRPTSSAVWLGLVLIMVGFPAMAAIALWRAKERT